MTGTDIAPVLAQREAWKSAFESRDVDRVMTFYADDDVTYDINPPLSFKSAVSRRDNWVSFFSGFTGDLANEHVIRSDDLAVDYHLTRVSGTTTFGTTAALWTRQTNVLRLIDGTWLFVNNHLSFPVDLTNNSAVTDLHP